MPKNDTPTGGAGSGEQASSFEERIRTIQRKVAEMGTGRPLTEEEWKAFMDELWGE